MERVLVFSHRNELFKVKENGDMTQFHSGEWSGKWKLLGVSTHHWHNRIIYSTRDLFDNPELMKKGYVWDFDHGAIRIWSGQYNCHLPRVNYAYITEMEV